MLNQQRTKISWFTSFNGFPSDISKSLLYYLRSLNETCQNENSLDDNNDNSLPVVVFWSPYTGSNGEQLLNHCLKKIKCCLKIIIKINVVYNTKGYYCSMKDNIPYEQKQHVAYELTFPDYGGKYVDKTKIRLLLMNKFSYSHDTESMFKHFSECELFKKSSSY